MIRLVIFDLDDVLYAYDRQVRVDRLCAKTGLPPERVREALWDGDFEDRAEAGEWPLGADYLAAFSRRLGAPLSRADWVDARRRAMTPDRAVIDLAAGVKPRANLGLLTNNPSLLREEIAAIVPDIVPIFAPHLHASVEFGARKPDPEVYRRYVERHGVAPAEALFVDDDADNAAGAEKAGLTGHHFTGAAGLRRLLEDLALLPPVP